jgi:hypothetical protein
VQADLCGAMMLLREAQALNVAVLHTHDVANAILLKLCRRCVRPDLIQMRVVIISIWPSA